MSAFVTRYVLQVSKECPPKKDTLPTNQLLSGHLIEFLHHEGELPEHVVEVGVDVDHAVVEPLNLNFVGRKEKNSSTYCFTLWLNRITHQKCI